MAKDEKDETDETDDQDPKPDQAQDNSSTEGEDRPPLSDDERTSVEEMTTLGQCRYCENDAVRMAEATSAERMSGLTAGMQLPPGFKMPF